MLEELKKIQYHIEDLAQIVIDKSLNDRYTLDDWFYSFGDSEVEIVFSHDDGTCSGQWDQTEIYPISILEMDTYDFAVYLDEEKEKEFQEQLAQKKRQQEHLVQKEIEAEEQEYQYYLELHEKYGDVDILQRR